MVDADYIIVGSGINSLVAAAMLGKKGHKVLVLERRQADAFAPRKSPRRDFNTM